jgi:NAD(P)-dependent dehydrogenase (short-subunit alcohol dehydrogenase family)
VVAGPATPRAAGKGILFARPAEFATTPRRPRATLLCIGGSCDIAEMELNLAEQNVVVFGAARGIGRAIAEGFAAERARVSTFDRDASASPLPLARAHVTGDVTRYEEVRAFAESVRDVDHVVFSVGVGSGKFGFPFWNLEPGDWSRVLEINLIGAVNVAHAFAPKLIARGRGSMLFLVSVAGQIGSQTDPPYSAAKAGLINFMQCAAKDLAPHGIRANALSPGMVKTDLNQSVWQAGQANLPPSERQDYAIWAEEKIRKVSPLGRWQTPPEFAAMAVFLASDHARNITGQTINIDGGQVMHA